MTISIEILAVTISTIILIIGFIISRNQESEARGRLLQRIDTLEITLKELKDKERITEEKITCHDGDLIKIEADIESLRGLMERIDNKLDLALSIR